MLPLAPTILAVTLMGMPGADPAPSNPGQLGTADRIRLVLLTAKWCQWCRVLEQEVLVDRRVRRILKERYRFLFADVDAGPAWMDLTGVEGLPSLAFFDRQGRHLLTRSGYRPPGDMADLLEDLALRMNAGDVKPERLRGSYPPLGSEVLHPKAARMTLARRERELFIAINSNDGGFKSPARHPQPDLLLEMVRWADLGSAPSRVRTGVERTVASALRGSSPRLEGEPLSGMTFGVETLRRLARLGSRAGPRWREGIDALPLFDPYLGLQDPIDAGVFRYAAGPGWVHPHFERRALDNLAWVLLLRKLGRTEEAKRIATFVRSTFDQGELLGAVQASDPFYYRLNARERRGVPAPPVTQRWLLKVQARAARVDPARCATLDRVQTSRWPRHYWARNSEHPDAPPASPDAVGELLLAMIDCRATTRADALATFVEAQWRADLLPLGYDRVRLHRLAAGLCAARPESCAAVLYALRDLSFSTDYPPPFGAFASSADTPIRRRRTRVRIKPRTVQMDKFPCGECHDLGEETLGVWARGHPNVVLAHTGPGETCASCHVMSDKTQLALQGLEPVSLNESHQLCGRCHAEKKRDWDINAHGKQSGGWRTQTVRWTCVECHDPHAPSPVFFRPEPPPEKPPFLIKSPLS